MMSRGAVILVALVPITVSQTWAQVDAGLFIEVPRPASDLSTPEVTVVRQRWVTVNLDQLRLSLPPSLGGADARGAVQLNVFSDVRLTAIFSRIDVTATGFVWVGQLEGVQGSTVTLAVTQDALAGSIVSPDAAYRVRYVGEGVHAVQQIDPTVFPRELPPVPVGVVDGGDVPSIAADDGSVIDVLVVYTPAARIAQGGTSAIGALIDLGISETNTAYANSGAIQRVRLVNKQEVTYTEANALDVDLSRLQMTSDGFLDSVHLLRDAYGADLVKLVVSGQDACGIGYLMTAPGASFASFAFSVTHYSCISPNYTFAHEMGHNMGLRHDVYVDSGTTPFTYSHGYVNQAALVPGAPSSKRWRDIMAYNDQCVASGFNCSRLLNFSNPSNIFTGDPMGHPSTADAVRSLNNTRVTVANFRPGTPASNLSINDVTLIEGNSGTTAATFTVSLSASSSFDVTVNYMTADSTAAAGADYVATSGALTISAGSTSRNVAITINGDVTPEASETFTVNLSSASGASIADGQGIARIVNDDFTDPSLSGVVTTTLHITQLRTLINDRRSMRNINQFSFQDEPLSPGTVVRAYHINELRTALAAVYTSAGQAAPTYKNDVESGIIIQAIDLSEIRDRALNAP